ncbi:MAG: hypothetical protein ABIY50_09585 [Ignavibacteria bacterium]
MKEEVLEIIKICAKMVDGRESGEINKLTYSTAFKPYLDEFNQNFSTSPNLYLQNSIKKFFSEELENIDHNIKFKSFGFWGNNIYNYVWTCIYFDFGQESMAASHSPQLYILVNKEGIKFGFCYGNYIKDEDEMVTQVKSKNILELLMKCFEKDKQLLFLNSSNNDITASPERLFEQNERLPTNTESDVVNNWSRNSLLIKEFPKTNIPENIEIQIDNTFRLLKEFYLSLLPINKPSEFVNNNFSVINLKMIYDDFLNTGLHVSDKLFSRFVCSILTKPFLILTGLSGSGKTKLAQAFAMWICEDESQYALIPVGADWTNREPLLGFPNGLDSKEYVKPDNGVLDLLLSAKDNPDKPHFLILDEMNLSHVERYFADFLSIMESGDQLKLYKGEQRESSDKTEIPAEIEMPKNLFIVGTVNIDETTYMFSPKVLDRANVIEFRVTKEEMEDYLKNPKPIDLEGIKAKGKGMSKNFIDLSRDKTTTFDDSKELNISLLLLFECLKVAGSEFGYRSAGEINRFAAIIKKLNPSYTLDNIIDFAVMQKLLPKLHGSKRKLESVLKTLLNQCLIDKIKTEDYLIEKSEITNSDLKYPVSAEKLRRMYKNLMQNGFTSYAEL